MREIKFRAFEKSLKEMIPVYSINFDRNMINENGAWRGFNEIELMQYTGLKDKHGKEIYEGDIIKYKTNKIQFSLVQWISDGFKTVKKISPTSTRTSTLGHFITEYQCEIIGNIYENPDLLTNK